MENVKLRWDLILRPYIDFVEKNYPDITNEEKFRILTDRLTNNEIKNRVLLHDNDVVAYAFYVDSVYGDRCIGNIGFLDEKYFNEARVSNLLNWIEINSDDRMIFLDEIFNASEDAERVLKDRGYSTLSRIRMTADLSSIRYGHEEIKFEKFDEKMIQEFSDAEFKAFTGTEDQILLPRSREMRVKYLADEIGGQETAIIRDASLVLIDDGIKAGLLSVSYAGSNDPYFSDIFVDPEYRRRGIASSMISTAASSLKQLGYNSVSLIVSENNPAIELYRKMGFSYSGQRKYTIHYRIRT
ncbi:GNAT family N-acetyltransferase [Thermoplasma sp. Kam2015]|uniref:GNAT family N-acetyltransferase n=1 Tax=Thermoplasma sp. Kam2015 TaxID=2094122 RepID=UPI001F447D0B|nr:GNAT family N-acetyltransferase [Thermoplasma sp. Kam2015]